MAWSDLAAARLVIAQRRDDPHTLFAALDAAERAVAADPKNPEALFNRALAFEYLSLNEQAQGVWRDYLAIDPHSGWADEARRRLARLRKEVDLATMQARTAQRLDDAVRDGDLSTAAELARKIPEQARQIVERKILPGWGRSFLAQESATAERHLAAARSIAAALRPISHDPLLEEVIAAIDSAADNPDRLATLGRGYSTFGEGMELYEARKNLERALTRLEEAQVHLKAGDSPFAGWTALYSAACDYSLSQFGKVATRLAPLAAAPELNRYPALAGRVLWQLGLSELARGEREQAIWRFHRASRAFQKSEDRESLAAVEDLLASAYDLLGDQARSWRHRYLVLRNLHWVTNPRRRWVIVKTTAESLLDRKEPRFALTMLDELVRLSGDYPESRSQALLRRSAAHAQLGDRERANRDAVDAEASIEQIEDPSLRSRIGVDWVVAQTLSTFRSDPESSLRLLEEPLRFYRSSENEILLARVLLAYARAALANGRAVEAERSLGEALQRAEGRWSEIKDRQLKISFLGELQEAFDDLLLAQQRNPEAAFATAERARARVLLEETGGRPLTWREIQGELSSGTVLVEYAIVRQRLFTWTLSREGLSFSSLDWEASGGAALIRDLRRVMHQKDRKAWQERLARLHEILLRPHTDRLSSGTPLVIVPHGPISEVPFPALLNEETGRYLIEDYPLVVAPSATLHALALRRARSAESPRFQSLLAIADPTFDRLWHSRLEPLPAAQVEAEAISRLYGSNALVLVGRQATPEAVARAVNGREVAHFAVHALVDAEEPERSALVLAPTSTDPSSGDLNAAGIERLPLTGTHLLVLSACSGAAGPRAKGEGTLSLVRSFLAAGVPTVVAGLWPLEDSASAEFFTLFHQRLRAGDDPAEALRKAQLRFLHSPAPDRSSPKTWGGIQVYGASGSQ